MFLNLFSISGDLCILVLFIYLFILLTCCWDSNSSPPTLQHAWCSAAHPYILVLEVLYDYLFTEHKCDSLKTVARSASMF
jgi:hypothetical protein